MTRLRLAPVVLTLLLVGCQELSQILSLQRGLARRYQTPAISVNISNNTSLTVLFVNSDFATAPDSARAALARDVANYVRDHYAAYQSLSTINVGFSASKSFGVGSYSRTEVPYSYNHEQLGAPQDSLKEPPPPALRR